MENGEKLENEFVETDTAENSASDENSGSVVDLTVGSPTKKIIMFALPLLAGNVFQLFYSWTDAIILGNVKGDALQFGALSASLPVVNLLLTVVMGFLAGAAVVLGQKFGKKNYVELKRCYSTLIISMGVLSVVIGVVGFFLSTPLLKLINVDESLIKYSSVYLKYYFAGIPFMIAYNTLAQVLRSLGNSKVPLIALIACVVLNVFLDYLFTVTMDMDIEGVALGTMIAQMISAVSMAVYAQKKMKLISLSKGDFVFDKPLFKAIVKLGVPSTIQNTCACVGFMVINAIVNSKGAVFTTAFGLGNRIDEILTQMLNSFGIAISAYAAQNKGKGEFKRITDGYRSLMLIMTGMVAVFATLILCFRSAILNVFIDTDSINPSEIDIDAVIEVAYAFLNIYLPCVVTVGYMIVSTSLLRGTGAANLAMTVNLFSFIVRVASALILDKVYIYGVFWASPIGWFAGAVWGVVLALKGGWKKHEI